MSPSCNGTLANRNLYLALPIIKARCQPIGSHVSYLTDSYIATNQELWSSLAISGLSIGSITGMFILFLCYFPFSISSDLTLIQHKRKPHRKLALEEMKYLFVFISVFVLFLFCLCYFFLLLFILFSYLSFYTSADLGAEFAVLAVGHIDTDAPR